MATRRTLNDPNLKVRFRCKNKHVFTCRPARIEEDERYDHPFNYYAICPECGIEASQAPWDKANFQFLARETWCERKKPNFTEEQKNRIKYNSLGRGKNIHATNFFDAKPDGYSFCKHCDVPRPVCAKNDFCITQTAHMMNYVEAFKKRDPSVIRDDIAVKHAHLQTIISMTMTEIIKDGPIIRKPVYEMADGIPVFIKVDDGNGNQVQLEEINAHPGMKILSEIMPKNHMSLGDWSMTPRIQDTGEMVRGFLDDEKESRQAVIEFQEQNNRQLESLQRLISGEALRESQEIDVTPSNVEYDGGQEDD